MRRQCAEHSRREFMVRARPPRDPVVDSKRSEVTPREVGLCLAKARMTVSYARDSVGASEVRKRMRLLDAPLHAQFMRQGVERE